MQWELRPLSFGEILDKALGLYFGRIGTLAAISAATLLPAAAIAVILSLYAWQEVAPGQPGWALYQIGDEIRRIDESRLIVVSILQVLIFVVAAQVAVGRCFRPVRDRYLGTPQHAVAPPARNSIVGLAALGLLFTVAVAFGAIGLVVGAVAAAVYLSLSIPTMLSERVGPIAAMRRSAQLVRHDWWRLAGLFLVPLAAMLTLRIVLVFALIPLEPIAADSLALYLIAINVATVIAMSAAVPLLATTMAVAYFDRLVRKEGYDIALLVDGLEHSPAAIAVES